MKRLNAILEQINNLIVIVQPNGEVQYISPSVKHILGFEPAELLGNNWWLKTAFDKTAEEARNLAVDIMNTSIRNFDGQFERQLRTSLGGSKWMLWSSTLNSDGTIVGIGSDITNKKNTELELEKRNKELLFKNREIEESLNYASRLQETILPGIEAYKNAFSDAFVCYKPKDIVSGDFHWFYETENHVFVAAVDCTGHGVPGAIMSVAGSNMLRSIVKSGVSKPSEILYRLDDEIQLAMSSKDGVTARDGMDLSLIVKNKQTGIVTFSGAFRPLIINRNRELIEFRGARYPIGFYSDDRKQFDDTVLDLQVGDLLYLFSDGYVDQFGGERGKKFNKKRFKELLVSMTNFEMEEQRSFLEYSLQNWRQEIEQTDDIVVIGLRI